LSQSGDLAATPRLLLLLIQSPFDGSSGAAVSMRHMAYLLAKSGWQVHALSTDLTEGDATNVFPHAARISRECDANTENQAILRVQHEGITFELIECGQHSPEHARVNRFDFFDRRYVEILDTFRPDLILTFGATHADLHRRAIARTRGIRVIFTLHNLAYLRDSIQEYDELLVPSAFMANRYAAAGYQQVHRLPPPMWDEEIIATEREPVFFTFVNPERAKGAELIAHLAARHPELPFLIVESRARSGHFKTIAKAAGIAIEKLDNIMFSSGAVLPKDIFAATRVLLMPSLVDEAAGRLAAESLANGIPTLVSDAGALPEIVGSIGTVLPFKTRNADIPVIDEATIALWSEQLGLLSQDDYYQVKASFVRSSGKQYTTAYQIDSYAAWFKSCLNFRPAYS
jgi:glycosyltransferase involved in cell wall biosynthesis